MAAKLLLSPEHIRNFWEKVQKGQSPDDCWIWTGGKVSGGYGALTVAGRSVSAHHLALIISGKVRPDPPNDHALHGDCCNRSCVNPEHLRWGSRVENIADMVRLGRSMRGERSNTCVLDVQSVKEIRQSPLSYTALADAFDVKKSAIAKIKTRKTWKHVK